MDQIVAASITHFIDMRAEFDDDTLNDSRITILWLPQVDDGEMRPLRHYRKGIKFAFPALALPNTRIFLHCSAGLNRGPTHIRPNHSDRRMETLSIPIGCSGNRI